MKTEAQNVVVEFLTAVQQGNNEKLPALLDANIQWRQPGTNQISGNKKSINEVFTMVGKMFEISANTLRLTEIKTIGVNGGQVACLLHWTATRPDGLVLDVDNIDVYTVENGKISQVFIYAVDLASEDLFWA